MRPYSEFMDGILGQEIPVLDRGFVRVIDYMGTDACIVNAARKSYTTDGKLPKDINKTIRFMMRKGHTSPFEMCEIKLHVKLPIFVMRQWVRHRMASLNEFSGRYAELSEEFYIPSIIRGQDDKNKQGSAGEVDDDSSAASIAFMDFVSSVCYRAYKRMISFGVSKELARTVLPVSVYTDMYWKIDVHNLFNFLRLRNAPDAQQEIAEYAECIENIVSKWLPMSYEAWNNFVKGSVKFSFEEICAIKSGVTPDFWSKNELEEFNEKTGILNISL